MFFIFFSHLFTTQPHSSQFLVTMYRTVKPRLTTDVVSTGRTAGKDDVVSIARTAVNLTNVVSTARTTGEY